MDWSNDVDRCKEKICMDDMGSEKLGQDLDMFGKSVVSPDQNPVSTTRQGGLFYHPDPTPTQNHSKSRSQKRRSTPQTKTPLQIQHRSYLLSRSF